MRKSISLSIYLSVHTYIPYILGCKYHCVGVGVYIYLCICRRSSFEGLRMLALLKDQSPEAHALAWALPEAQKQPF